MPKDKWNDFTPEQKKSLEESWKKGQQYSSPKFLAKKAIGALKHLQERADTQEDRGRQLGETFKKNLLPMVKAQVGALQGEGVEKFKLTPAFTKWNKDRKKIEEMGIMLQGEFLENTRKAQISQQSFMDWSRLYEFHGKVEPREQTQEVPGM